MSPNDPPGTLNLISGKRTFARPSRGTLLVMLAGTATPAITALGISKAGWEAYTCLAVCVLCIAWLIFKVR